MRRSRKKETDCPKEKRKKEKKQKHRPIERLALLVRDKYKKKDRRIRRQRMNQPAKRELKKSQEAYKE